MKIAVFLLLAFCSTLYVQADEPQEIVTLNQCLDASFKNGPEVLLSGTNLAISQAQYRQAVAQNSLGLGGSAGASRTTNIVDTVTQLGGPGIPREYSPFITSTTVPTPTNTAKTSLNLTGPRTQLGLAASYKLAEQDPLSHSTSLSLSASQTLWDGYPGGRGRGAVQQAGLTLRSKQVENEATRKDLAYQVKQAYYTMLAAQRQLQVLQDSLAQRQEELRRFQTLFEMQNATKIDVKQAQVNATTAVLDLRLSKSNLAIVREKLSTLVGWPADKEYAVAEVEDLSVPSLDVLEAVRTAFGNRDDLRQLQLSKASGHINLALAKSQALPTISATGGLSWTRDWTTTQDFGSWDAGLQVSLPILDAGLTEAQIKVAALQNQAYRIQEEQLAANIATEVKNAIYSLKDLLARAELAQASLDLARDLYELAEVQFQEGTSSSLDLLDASVKLTTAQVNLAKARNDAQLGVLSLQNAMGI